MIAWDLRSAREHPALAAGEPPPGFLSAPERVLFDRLRTPRRQKEWLLGRWAAKGLVRAWLRSVGRAVGPEALTVAPDVDGAPFVLLMGEGRLPITISISHREGLALCALTLEPDAPLGADLELCETRSPAFVEDFFTLREAAAIARAPDPARAATELWSLKEAALKAVRLGLRADTRRVEAGLRGVPTEGWARAAVELVLPDRRTRGQAFVRDCGDYVVSIAWLGGRLIERPIALLRESLALGESQIAWPADRAGARGRAQPLRTSTVDC